MRKFLDRIITGFFVGVFGLAWYWSTRHSFRSTKYTITVYDVFGKPITLDGIRTEFQTREVAQSYISEYREKFTHYTFSMTVDYIQIKKKIFKIPV